MKVILEKLKAPMPLSEFADAHGLTMVVKQLSERWYIANFDHVERKEGSMLVGEHGRGFTPDDAMANYAEHLSGSLIVFHAYGDNRKEINCPNLKHGV